MSLQLNNKFTKNSSLAPTSKGEKTFDVINVIIMLIIALICIFPLYYVFICSVSRGSAVDSGKVLFFPIGLNLASFNEILNMKQFWISYGNTLFYTIVGTLFSMIVSSPAAFALSNKQLVGRKWINLLLSLTLWLHPGFIPLYLNYSNLHVENNRWMIIISFGIQAFNIILLRNYFEAVPPEMNESAKIDGANDFRVFWNIYIPLSKPSLATVTLYYAMSRWNSFFWTLVLLKDMNKIPLQVFIRQKIIEQSLVEEYAQAAGGAVYSYTTLVYALVVCAVIPVLIVFPLIQKFFTKGVMVGAVKG